METEINTFLQKAWKQVPLVELEQVLIAIKRSDIQLAEHILEVRLGVNVDDQLKKSSKA